MNIPELACEGQRGLFDCLVVEDEVEPEKEDDESVTHVSEHDSEEEREGYSGEDSRIQLLISRHTIGIYDLLRNDCIAVGVKSSRRFFCLYFLHLGRW